MKRISSALSQELSPTIVPTEGFELVNFEISFSTDQIEGSIFSDEIQFTLHPQPQEESPIIFLAVHGEAYLLKSVEFPGETRPLGRDSSIFHLAADIDAEREID